MNASPAAFGELLRLLRNRKKLTQQKLADLLSVHRNTIGSWERGDFLPESKALMLELAQTLDLNEFETRQLLEASLTALAPYWSVPFRRNPIFTGRQALVEALHSWLGVGQPLALAQAVALCGLGGIGKTQVAVEYAYRYTLEYSAVFWLAAETAESLMSSLQPIANQLQLPERTSAQQAHMVSAVQRWLLTHSDWLVIADNVEDLDLLQSVLPPTPQGALFLTTRRQALGPLVQVLELLPMSQEEGARLLLRRTGRLSASASGFALPSEPALDALDQAEVGELVELLGGLPLALDQAGAYIEESGCGLADYLHRYRHQRKQLLGHRGMAGGMHPASVLTTLSLAVERIERAHAGAADLLRVCAFLHPDAIPEELLVAAASHLGTELAVVLADPYLFDLTLAALRSASLITRHPQTRTFSVHRLVQAVLQEQMAPAQARLYHERLICAVNELFPAEAFEAWSHCERLLGQAMACISLIPRLDSALPEAGSLLFKTGSYLMARGRFAEAEPLLEQALGWEEQWQHADPLALLPLLERRAELCWRQGHYEPAERLIRRVLAIGKEHLGQEHLQVARTLNQLGLLCWNQGKYVEAETCYLQTLRIREQQAEPEQPDRVAATINNLALLSSERGQYHQAETLFAQALHVRLEHLGPEHPSTALSFTALASVQLDLEKYTHAEPLLLRALQIEEQQLGSHHPQTLFTLHGLGYLYERQEKYEQAERCYLRVLHAREDLLGPEHPDTLLTLPDLASLSQKMEKQEQAESLYQRAMHLLERQLGPEHPKIIPTLAGLANLYRTKKQYQQAESLYQRALTLIEQRLLPDHPELITPLTGLASLYGETQRAEQAEPLYRRALVIAEQCLGPKHPRTLQLQRESASRFRPREPRE